MNRSSTLIFLITSLSVCVTVHAQTSGTWQTLSAAPVTQRHNDLYFVTSTLGWIVNGSGQIYKTRNGGVSWQLQFEKSTAHFRSVGFIDSLHGWAGNVGSGEFGATDTTVFYRTADGGITWTPVNTFNGPKPRGICGMHVVNDSVICAVGRVRGPSFFVKTVDRGITWTSKDMSAYATGLIDVYFSHPDTGFAVGLSNVVHDSSSGVVLITTDGGSTWEKRFVTTRKGEWCWKISFPSRSVGYVSLQRNTLTPIFFLKTTDGGNTWREKLFSNFYYYVQGIGFATEQIGWAGGNSSFPTYQTTDGGETWRSANFGVRVNRFCFFRDTLGYAVGQTVYKYSKNVSTGVAAYQLTPLSFELGQNYPNPFNPTTVIRYVIPISGHVSLKVYDVLGREIKTVIDEIEEEGTKALVFDASNLPTGVYYYRLVAGSLVETKKMVVLR